MPSVICRKAVNGAVAPGKVSTKKLSKVPMMLTLPVPASMMVWSQSRIALHFGGGFLPFRFFLRAIAGTLLTLQEWQHSAGSPDAGPEKSPRFRELAV